MGDLRIGRPDEAPFVVGLADHFLGDDFPERLDVDGLVGLLETFRKGADELLLGRGVDDGEGDLLEGPFEVVFQRLMEELRDEMAVVTEGPATPGAEDKRVVAVHLRHGQDLADAVTEDVGDMDEFFRMEVLGERSRRGDERGPIGGREQAMVVVPEDGHVRRVDHSIAVAVMSFPTMIGIHRRVFDGQIKGTGAAEVLLLRPGAGQEAATGMGGRGEVQGDGLVSFGEMSPMGGEGGLVGYFVDGRVRARGRGRMDVSGGVVDGRLHAGLHFGRDTDQAGRTDVFASLGDHDGLFAQLDGEITIDAGFEELHFRSLWYWVSRGCARRRRSAG